MRFRKAKDDRKGKLHGFGIILKNKDGQHGFVSYKGWKEFTKKDKVSFIVSILIYICVFALCILYLSYAPEIHKYFNNLATTMTGDVRIWVVQHIPSVFDTIVSIIGFIVIYNIFKLIKTLIKFKTQKSKTITCLIFSVNNYFLFIIMVLLILTGWGVDTVALVASAGVLTLIVGLGAQSIVEDLVAGVFIAIEGYIAVGDIVYYGDFIGTVREIGLRVTTIENLNNYIEVVRNSEISEIVNTSRGITYNKVNFTIPHKFKSEKIDAFFEANLEKIKASHEDITKLFYLGIVEFSNWGAVYCLAFTCAENRVLQSKAAINNTVYKLLEELGIYENK